MDEAPRPVDGGEVDESGTFPGDEGEGGLVVSTPPLKTPDITPAQIVAGIPILAEFGHAFGIYDLSQAQQDSLGKLVLWGIALLGADAAIRIGRAIGKRLT